MAAAAAQEKDREEDEAKEDDEKMKEKDDKAQADEKAKASPVGACLRKMISCSMRCV